MSLAERCKNAISRSDWRKGKEYFYAQAVKQLRQTQDTLVAIVAGSDRYVVQLNWHQVLSQKKLKIDCTCPRFADMDNCKHIAATILQVDHEGLADCIPGSSALRLVRLINSRPGELDADWDDEAPDWDQKLPSEGNDDVPVRGVAAQLRGSIPPATAACAKPRQAPAGRGGLTQSFSKLQREFAAYLLKSVPSGRALPTKPRKIYFTLDLKSSQADEVVIDLWQQSALKGGGFGAPKQLNLDHSLVTATEDDAERALLSRLLECGVCAGGSGGYYGYYRYANGRFSRLEIPTTLADLLLPELCASGKLFLKISETQSMPAAEPLVWDDGPAWDFRLKAIAAGGKDAWQVAGELVRNHETVELSGLAAILPSGLMLRENRMSKWISAKHWPWVAHLRREGPIAINKDEIDQAVSQLFLLPSLPPLELPTAWNWRQIAGTPQPCIKLTKRKHVTYNADFDATVSFKYGSIELPAFERNAAVVDRTAKQVLLRDSAAEQQLQQSLRSYGFRTSRYAYERDRFELTASKFTSVIERLIAENWQVVAEGEALRTPGQFSISVTSGVDWFDLAAECDFGGIVATLPELLAAVRNGNGFVMLGDGSRGILPKEWLERYSSLADLGETKADVLRFKAPQASILDALLAAHPKVQCDVAFTRIRRKLQQFEGIAAKREPPTFQGTLREYQREGLGWLHFLQEFGCGGCLADDMGLGKTVQVLALLEGRRKLNRRKQAEHRPTLVVVPKSLVFNWLEEAKRFTPKLRTVDYTGLQRGAALACLDQIDLIVTTYGTLRRDIVKLREIPFDYLILDEAQAIKNASSQSAKTCRLLQARHRLAMTGTPVENHLGELWSLFEFLNPGMLGRSGKLLSLASKSRTGDAESLDLLRRALRPYMLRRTKTQVLKELPDKTEQTLHCDLEGEERKRYDELREHYRASLQKRIDEVGFKKAKLHVLEALLRLRQAACHGGLIDKQRTRESSSKLELLLEQLQAVRAEGHKALVFSQFTSFLDIVRGALDQEKIVYEYLDGKTRDRQARVERFQTDAKCPLFLISLKAGGHGLNLTAADYVFILDPWWNPAVEMQAVDRAHRIGQTKPVFAYRLIARNTVEEKILELQQQKRELAEAIIAADDRLLANLSAEDLRLLLG